MTIQEYIYRHLVLLIRYAKDNYRQHIQCTSSCQSNRTGKRTKASITERGSAENTAGTQLRIRTCQGDILQSQPCKEDTEKRGLINEIIMSAHLFFYKLKLTWLLVALFDLTYNPECLKIIPRVWRSEIIK